MDSDENDFRNGFDKFYLCGESGDHTVKDGRVFVRGAPSERDNFQTLNKICRRAHLWSKNNKNCNKSPKEIQKKDVVSFRDKFANHCFTS